MPRRARTRAAEGTSLRTTIHLIRHADAVPEVTTFLAAGTGYDGLGLSLTGVAQAQALARRLATGRVRLAAIYTSPTPRAFQTAGIVAAPLGLDLTVTPELREIFLGEVPGGDVAPAERPRAIRARLDELAAIAVRDGSWASVPNAEPASDVRARMTAAVQAVVARHPGTHVALVSHAGAINAYLASVVGTARDFFFLAGNTSLSSLRFADGTASLIRLNDTAHLETLDASAHEKPPL